MTSATREKIVSLIFSPKGEKLQWILPVQKVKSSGKLKGVGYYLTLTTLDVYQPFTLYVSLVIDGSSGNSSGGISGFPSVGLNLSGWEPHLPQELEEKSNGMLRIFVLLTGTILSHRPQHELQVALAVYSSISMYRIAYSVSWLLMGLRSTISSSASFGCVKIIASQL